MQHRTHASVKNETRLDARQFKVASRGLEQAVEASSLSKTRSLAFLSKLRRLRYLTTGCPELRGGVFPGTRHATQVLVVPCRTERGSPVVDLATYSRLALTITAMVHSSGCNRTVLP